MARVTGPLTLAEIAAMDAWLDNFESLLIAIRQRRMVDGQRERFARLLADGQRDVIERGHDEKGYAKATRAQRATRGAR